MNRSVNASHAEDNCQAIRTRINNESTWKQAPESALALLQRSELESENRRLHHLIAELILDNEQLRVKVEAVELQANKSRTALPLEILGRESICMKEGERVWA